MDNNKKKKDFDYNYFYYKLGKFYNFWQIFSPIIFLFLIGYIFYLKRPPAPSIAVSPAIVIENGQVSRLACNSEDEGFKSVAISLSETLSQILYAYSSDDAYAAKTAAFGSNFDESSDYAVKFHDLIVKNIEATKGGKSAQFVIDKKSIKAGSLPSNYSIFVVILSGTQLVQSKAGTNSSIKKISVTFKFNLNRGQDGKIFKIIGFNPEFSSM